MCSHHRPNTACACPKALMRHCSTEQCFFRETCAQSLWCFLLPVCTWQDGGIFVLRANQMHQRWILEGVRITMCSVIQRSLFMKPDGRRPTFDICDKQISSNLTFPLRSTVLPSLSGCLLTPVNINCVKSPQPSWRSAEKKCNASKARTSLCLVLIMPWLKRKGFAASTSMSVCLCVFLCLCIFALLNLKFGFEWSSGSCWTDWQSPMLERQSTAARFASVPMPWANEPMHCRI